MPFFGPVMQGGGGTVHTSPDIVPGLKVKLRPSEITPTLQTHTFYECKTKLIEDEVETHLHQQGGARCLALVFPSRRSTPPSAADV